MSSRLEKTFVHLIGENKKALVIYLTAGDPELTASVEAAVAAVNAGADILEVGVPFSDPVADGEVIQRAMERALAKGGGFVQSLEVIAAIRARVDVPIVVFGYLNPFLWPGFAVSCGKIAAAGADGILVVDAPLEESEPLRQAAVAAGLSYIALAAPTSGKERAARIAVGASGFIYLVAMTGVTGGTLVDYDRARAVAHTLKQKSSLPVCMGFGIRDAATAKTAAHDVDGIVVGSAAVRILEQNPGQAAVQKLTQFVKDIKIALDSET